MDEVYDHEYYFSGVEIQMDDTVPEILGKADASDEWNHPEHAVANYININSYNRFADASCVFLVGRIGSGKTAMLNKLQYSIQQGRNTDYQNAIMIDTNDYIASLGIAIRFTQLGGALYSEIEYIARKEWKKTLRLLAMKELYDKYADKNPNDFCKIKEYLEEQGELEHQASPRMVLQRIAESLRGVEHPLVQGIAVTAQTLGDLTSVTYNDASRELDAVVSKYGRILILVDSIEKYAFNDVIVLAILNALVNVSLEFDRSESRIRIKMAAPSELIPKLTAINPEKIASKIVYVKWTYRDLKKFIAVRLYRYVNGVKDGEKVDVDAATSFFDDYYKPYCMTRCRFLFPTFSYCVTNTLKAPRQLLTIFNAWIYFSSLHRDSDRMELVTRAIAYGGVNRIRGALSIYSSIHPQMLEMFQRTFSKRKYCFTESEFDAWLSDCSNLRGNVDAYELKRYFISSGLVGVMVDMHRIKKGNKDLQNDRMVRIKEAVFEYQYKEYLAFNNDTKFCLHPMTYSVLNIEVDRNTFVYPRPIEEEGEFVPWAEPTA